MRPTTAMVLPVVEYRALISSIGKSWLPGTSVKYPTESSAIMARTGTWAWWRDWACTALPIWGVRK